MPISVSAGGLPTVEGEVGWREEEIPEGEKWALTLGDRAH
jgi:hypothetical protein